MVEIPTGDFYERKFTPFSTETGTHLLVGTDIDRVLLSINGPPGMDIRVGPSPQVSTDLGISIGIFFNSLQFVFRDWGGVMGEEWFYHDNIGFTQLTIIEVFYRTRRKLIVIGEEI